MIDFPTGVWRKATGAARGLRLSSAQELVTRTLARHGLAPGGPDASAPGPTSPGGPSGLPVALAAMLARKPKGATATPAATPPGASFAEGSFSCAAGSRNYRTYVPASAQGGVAGLVVMLHGCTQTPEDFAAGTGMNALAEMHRLVILYPQQSRGHNAQSCWNWFSRGDQRRDRGEPSILAGMTREAIAGHGIPADRVFVAGLSAGAAMAVILGETYPDLFSAVGAHSGLPMGAASDVPSAFAAMAGQGAVAPATGPAMRTIIFHGSADATVHPSNGEKIARHALDRGPRQSLQTEDKGMVGGRSFRRSTTLAEGGTELVEHWIVEGMGHAWSGGQPGGSYTDAQGPDASAEMIRFFLAGKSAS
ncbi:PHB depolymerase family esterase [Frigidibacter albus]|uniref:PHB depolymerase family esterase n=1 Tax=Frigidibacter albus TaxID=1465486 RepID=A0A6L8VJF3_9RHOB|nr:PHB depolymerase family esterase [Frigidibacter albus]MZQ89310.1 PHB depolymerase family esterase [Frigidibacter albus]NBE31216.1 PHB depolymerase family esterase [Frigidibacter albus]GGH53525.1 poly(3-hydroxybutyrate) depolymerase [Frigidibacter albus]